MRVLVLLLLLCFAFPALAAEESIPAALDHRVHTMMYQPDEVYKFTGHYGFQSAIEFGPDETIQTISMGDSTAWMLQPSGNRLFLKPIEQGATTNMTLITNRRTYLFELHGREAQDISDPNMTFILRFLYPSENSGGVKNYLDSVPLPDLEREPGKYNFNYTLSGPEAVSPIRIFDDGQFTYFQFRNKNSDVPAFFLVDGQGNESIINYRTRGDYIVVERVGPRFTLRYGSAIVCIFNDGFPKRLEANPPQTKSAPVK